MSAVWLALGAAFVALISVFIALNAANKAKRDKSAQGDGGGTLTSTGSHRSGDRDGDSDGDSDGGGDGGGGD